MPPSCPEQRRRTPILAVTWYGPSVVPGLRGIVYRCYCIASILARSSSSHGMTTSCLASGDQTRGCSLNDSPRWSTSSVSCETCATRSCPLRSSLVPMSRPQSWRNTGEGCERCRRIGRRFDSPMALHWPTRGRREPSSVCSRGSIAARWPRWREVTTTRAEESRMSVQTAPLTTASGLYRRSTRWEARPLTLMRHFSERAMALWD